MVGLPPRPRARCEFGENSHRDSMWKIPLNSSRVSGTEEAGTQPNTVDNREEEEMEAYRIDHFGSVDGIVLRSSEAPWPGPKQLLMRVRASSLNYRGLMVLKGGGRGRTKLGVVPLSDGVGEVRRPAMGSRGSKLATELPVAFIRGGLAGRSSPIA
jgi:hypothetical protein